VSTLKPSLFENLRDQFQESIEMFAPRDRSPISAVFAASNSPWISPVTFQLMAARLPKPHDSVPQALFQVGNQVTHGRFKDRVRGS
jgi:hypothetical protein